MTSEVMTAKVLVFRVSLGFGAGAVTKGNVEYTAMHRLYAYVIASTAHL